MAMGLSTNALLRQLAIPLEASQPIENVLGAADGKGTGIRTLPPRGGLQGFAEFGRGVWRGAMVAVAVGRFQQQDIGVPEPLRVAQQGVAVTQIAGEDQRPGVPIAPASSSSSMMAAPMMWPASWNFRRSPDKISVSAP